MDVAAGTCASRKFLNLGQSVFRIIRVLGRVACRKQCLADQISVVAVLIGMVGIRRELIPWVHDSPTRGAIPHRIVGKVLRIQQQRMAGTREPIQLVIAEGLRPSAVCEVGSVAHRIVAVFGFIDLLADGCELMADG